MEQQRGFRRAIGGGRGDCCASVGRVVGWWWTGAKGNGNSRFPSGMTNKGEWLWYGCCLWRGWWLSHV